jgi:hypothetical protein
MSGSARRSISRSQLWQQLALLAAAHPPELAVNHALAWLGSAHRADRVWIVRYNDDLTRFWNTHEWTRDDVTPHVEDLQAASVDVIRWLHRQLAKAVTVPVPDVEQLPRQARGFQAELRRQKIRSSVNVPLFHEGKLRGIFGYDMVRRSEKWPEDLVRLVTDAGEYIAALLYSSADDGQVPAAPVRSSPQTIYIRSGGTVMAVNRDDLIVIEADGDYTHLHFAGRPAYTELRSLKSWESQLPEEEFLRVSQRHIVRSRRIRQLDRSAGGWTLHLHDWEQPLVVGRAYRYRIRQHLGF